MVEAEAILLQMQKDFDSRNPQQMETLSKEFYQLLPHRNEEPLLSWQKVMKEKEMCQVLFFLNVKRKDCLFIICFACLIFFGIGCHTYTEYYIVIDMQYLFQFNAKASN